MEVRERGHSPPFWASSSNASTSNPSPSSPYSSSNSTQSGIRPWVIVVVFSIVALLFLPYILSSPSSSSSSSKSGRFNLSIKSGWDVFNLCLVVFAIFCGVLGRIGERSGPDSGSYKQQPRNEWRGYMNQNQMGDVNRTAMIRRSRSSSSYPDPRLETDMWGQNQNRVPDGWRFFDDAELYRARRPVQSYGVLGSSDEERECKTIPVDTQRFPQMVHVENQIEKFPQMGHMENEINFGEGNMVSGGAMYEEEKKVREAMVVRRRMRSLEALPKWEEVENEPTMVVGRRRRRSLERFPSIKEAEKETIFQEQVEVQEEEVENRQMVVRRGGKSMETFPVMNEIKEETKLEEEIAEKAPEAVVSRTDSCESVPEIEEIEKDANIEDNVVEKPPIVVEVTPPPPPPPPPPSEKKAVVEECRKHKRSGSGGGAKDIASAIALLYQKKKGSKSKRKEKQEVSIESNLNLNSVTESNSSNPSTTPPPPPPPPPPASIFHQLFSNKKGGNKSRKIHSLSQSASSHSTSHSTVNIITTPPPLPPPPYHKPHRSIEDQVASSGYRRIEHTELYENRRRERPKLSRFANYPLPPRSPLPPPPPSPPPVCENISEITAPAEQRTGNVEVYCPSPDVNDEADLFIRRFRDGLKLEKINSIREKEKRKEGRKERDGN